MTAQKSAAEVLSETSRTFYPSIDRLPPRIKEAVASSYLSLRAIDEIEDHPDLDKNIKVRMLCALSAEISKQFPLSHRPCYQILKTHSHILPEVTIRIDEWLGLAPATIAPTIHHATSVMAQRMAFWVNNDWRVRSKHNLDRYTFTVAGAVGVLLSDLWIWYDGTGSRKSDAIGYGRGLQAVNILRNRQEDLRRGVDFFPDGWDEADFFSYARTSLLRGDAYVNAFPPGPAYDFCRGPQALAHATLDALARGESKLTRTRVLEILDAKDRPMIINQSAPREEVLLVNERDEVIGTEEKIKAHLDGALHRAFSVFILNSADELLLQRRTPTKYHSKGLWSNTCCGHPRPGETVEQASHRRLQEEMGFCAKLEKGFEFTYHAKLEDGLTEHEFDHVLTGKFDGIPQPDSREVAEWRWMDLPSLQLDVEQHPEHYTYWFRLSLNKFRLHVDSRRAHFARVATGR